MSRWQVRLITFHPVNPHVVSRLDGRMMEYCSCMKRIWKVYIMYEFQLRIHPSRLIISPTRENFEQTWQTLFCAVWPTNPASCFYSPRWFRGPWNILTLWYRQTVILCLEKFYETWWQFTKLTKNKLVTSFITDNPQNFSAQKYTSSTRP